MLGLTSRALLLEKPDAYQPKCSCADGLAKGGSRDAHKLTAQLIAEKASEWGEQVWYLEVDLLGAFGSIRYPEIWRTLHEIMSAEAARAMMKVITGHSLVPSWTGIPGEEVPAWKGCRQGALESPRFGIACWTKPWPQCCSNGRTWESEQTPRPLIPNTTVGNPRLGLSDDLVLIGPCADEAHGVRGRMVQARDQWGLTLR